MWLCKYSNYARSYFEQVYYWWQIFGQFFTISFSSFLYSKLYLQYVHIIINNLVQLLMRIFAVMIVACVANYWLAIPSCIIIIVLVLFRHYFLQTSRNVQRLEALGKPIYQIQNIIKIILLHKLVVHYIHTSLLQFKAYHV